MTENSKQASIKVKTWVPDASTITSSMFAYYLKSIAATHIQATGERLADNTLVRLGRQIVQTTPPQLITHADLHKLPPSDLLAKSSLMNDQIRRNFQDEAFVTLTILFFGYSLGSLGRNLTSRFLVETGLHKPFSFFANEASKREEAEKSHELTHSILRNTGGIIIGGISGVLFAMLAGYAIKDGSSPLLTGIKVGSFAAFVGCLQAEFQDSVIVPLRLENNAPSSNPS